MRKLGIALISVALSLSSLGLADAATSKPKPSAKPHSTTKPHSATTKVAKRIFTPKPRSTPKPRVITKPKPAPKPIPKPIPKPVWPPKGFMPQNGIYAHIPSGAELVKQLTATSQLITECEKIACGAVYIASDTPCNYWVLGAVVSGPDPADVSKSTPYGTMRILLGATKARTVYPIILRSNEPMIAHESLVLQTLNLKKDAFYKAIAQGKSLTQIAGSQLSTLVKALTQAELDSITAQLAAATITDDAATALRNETPARIGLELTQYNLTVGSISMQCWTMPPTETVPSNSYTPNANHF